MKKEIKIDGMHCDHCAMKVEKALSSIDAVKKVKVNLKKGEAKIDCDAEVSTEEIKSKIDEAGFTFVSVE